MSYSFKLSGLHWLAYPLTYACAEIDHVVILLRVADSLASWPRIGQAKNINQSLVTA